MDAVTRRLTAARPWGRTPERVDMFVRSARRTLRATGGRVVAIMVGGEVQAVARVYGTGTVRQIEEVEVVEAHRGAGLGRAVVLASLYHALRADPELVFVVADAADWPWRWYQRLGFRPVGRTGGFDRDV